MQVHGNLNMNGNALQQVRIDPETGFPANPVPGRILFHEEHRTLYICAELIDGLPVWVPTAQVKDMFRHPQNEAALEWVVQHNLNMAPVMIQVFDVDGNWVLPNKIIANNSNSAIVQFNTPTAGTAIALRGEQFGSRASDIAFQADFTNSDTWVVNHGLGRNPDIKCYVDNRMVQPASIVHNSTMQATVTFTTPQTGTAVCY